MSLIKVKNATEEDWPSLDAQKPSETDDWELLASDEPEVKESEDTVIVEPQRPRSLSSSFSTPDLSRYDLLDSVQEDSSMKFNDDSSYDLVSGPRSVMSVSSTLSFRDAILSRTVSNDSNTENKTNKPNLRPFRFKPKFVVEPIKRCAKSTGDLQSLGKIDEGDYDEIVGDSDAMEFYHRKSAGAQSRCNSAKIRPDEAKRLQISMHKKNLQRKKNAS